MRLLRFIPLILACLSAVAFGAETDISTCFYSQPKPEAIVLGGNDVFVANLPDGSGAAVQFTEFSLQDGSYRWRFRKSPDSGIQSGVGKVFEDFAQFPLPKGNSLVLSKRSSESLYVTAGEIRFIWSVKDRKSAFVYYCPHLAKVHVVTGSAFGSMP